MKQEQIQARKQRGYEIAQKSRITQNEKGQWKVPSQGGSGYYMVVSNGFEAKCSCPDYETRRCKCKHLWAVELIVTQEVDNEGNVTITKTIRKTYKQDWSSYNMSQQMEKERFMQLLSEITNRVHQPAYNFGRPNNSLGDSIYAMVFKVYSGFSGRRFASDMRDSLQKEYINQKIPYNSMFRYFQKKELTPLLAQIVQLTSLPLQTVEKDFAVDSTGFGTSNFQRWFSFKHGKEINSRKWVKCHFMCGVKSNIVTSVKITSEFDNDCPQFKELVEKTAENFNMEEVSGDKAYLSRDNMNLVKEKGALPFIPFKSNSTGKAKGSFTWKKMYHYFMLNNEEFLQHYHKRSNVETTVHMVKSKFGDKVRSKSWNAQVNEVLCKIICHNICVVIQEMHEVGIDPSFCLKSHDSAPEVGLMGNL
jgi:transposase